MPLAVTLTVRTALTDQQAFYILRVLRYGMRSTFTVEREHALLMVHVDGRKVEAMRKLATHRRVGTSSSTCTYRHETALALSPLTLSPRTDFV